MVLEGLRRRIGILFGKKAQEIRLTDIAAYIERSQRIESQRAALAYIYEIRRQLIRNRIQELYGVKIPGQPKKKIRIQEPYVSYDPILEKYGHDFRILSESQKRYLAQVQHEVIMSWIFPKMGALDDPNARRIIEDYFEIYKHTHLLGGRALDDWLELQERILAIGWTKEEARLPPIFMVELPITVAPEPAIREYATALAREMKAYIRGDWISSGFEDEIEGDEYGEGEEEG